MSVLRLSPKEQEMKEKFETVRAYLIETHQTLIDSETMVRLIDLIVEDIRQRLIKVKKELFENNCAGPLSKRELAKLYFEFTTALDEGIDDVKSRRLMRAMCAFHETGNYFMWDHAYKYRITGLNAALLLYLRYYTERGFNVISYTDVQFMNKIERVLYKYANKYFYDETVNVEEFSAKLDQVADRVKLFYRNTFKGWV